MIKKGQREIDRDLEGTNTKLPKMDDIYQNTIGMCRLLAKKMKTVCRDVDEDECSHFNYVKEILVVIKQIAESKNMVLDSL